MGGGRWYGLLGGQVLACKAPGKLEGSGQILIIYLLLDTIWWNLGLFLQKHLSGVNYDFCACILHVLITCKIEFSAYLRAGKPKPRGGKPKPRGGKCKM